MDCREKVADAHATRGEPSFYDYAPAMNAANLLDLILIHRRELPFVLDPWTL
jgi:hypothetical protein